MDNTLINMISDLKSLYNFQAKKINEIDVLKKEHLETQDLLFEQIKSLQLKVNEVTQEYAEKVNELKQEYDTLKHKSEIDYETLKKEKENVEHEVIQLKQHEQVTYTELMKYINNLQTEINELKEQNKNNHLELSNINKEHITTALKIITNKVNISAEINVFVHFACNERQHVIINKDTEEDINMIDRVYGKYLLKKEYNIKISQVYPEWKVETDEIVYQLFNKKILVPNYITDYIHLTRHIYTLIYDFNKTYNTKFMFIGVLPSRYDSCFNYKIYIYEFI